MTLHGHPLRDWRRVGRWRAALRSSTVTRVAVLAGLSGMAWLAGITAAHADPASGVPVENAHPSDLVAVNTTVTPPAAGSELAARAPVNQPESVVESILTAPTEVLGGLTAPRADSTDVDASADATATDTTGPSPLDETRRPTGAAAGSPSGPSPLLSVVDPVASNLAIVTSGVGDVLGGVARPVSETVRPIDSVVTGLAPSAVPGPLVSPLPVPGEGTKLRFDSHRIDSGTSTAHQRATAAGAPDEPGDWHATGVSVSEGDVHWVHDAFARHSDPTAPSFPLRPDTGRNTAGVAPSGVSAGGSVLVDNGVGHPVPTRLDGGAVSRVTPRTAVFGQLPDHVTDPAVSPD